MATPKKVDSITLSSTTLQDNGLTMTQISRSSLITWLGGVSSSNVAVFFQEDTSGIHMVMAEIDASGKPSSTVQFGSGVLPCPPYCPR